MRKNLFLATIFASCSIAGFAQEKDYTFREMYNTYIPGAPKLSQPHFIKCTDNSYVRVEKKGLTGLNIFDWDGDGLKDLLIGEFGSKKVGSNIKVFKNVGSNKKPAYSPDYTYAKDKNGVKLAINGY